MNDDIDLKIEAIAEKRRKHTEAAFEQMTRHMLEPTNELALVLRGHLYAEAMVVRLLSENLQKPSALNLERLSFVHKVGFARAAGLLEDEMTTALLRLNRLRNKFAHNLAYRLTDRDAEKLLAAIPEMTRRFQLGLPGAPPFDRVNRAVYFLCGALNSWLKEPLVPETAQ